MFGKKKGASEEAPANNRYVVDVLHANKMAVKDHLDYGRNVQNVLNHGDSRGWRLVSMQNIGGSAALMLTWDTKPN